MRVAYTAQLGPDSPVVYSQRVCRRDLVLARLQLDPKIAGHLVADPDWLAIMIPLRWDTPYLFNGLLARPFDVFLSSGPDGYATLSERRDNLTLGLRKTMLQNSLKALSAGRDNEAALRDQRPPPRKGSGHRATKPPAGAVERRLCRFSGRRALSPFF
ncbi:hypothetical protein HPQ64_00860 [Rhizobiales bacterium]|uniref:hypothetical protein n=1 Tax=Hongsoonwoonella zoysiae TaxID=2821844 RepID=UPI00155F9117|nr:hypothetical protein [Hongsoonwoonella zoysiae]NRG16233.1 hypothetical protein [Hongsoonwoonella zoysiae]